MPTKLARRNLYVCLHLEMSSILLFRDVSVFAVTIQAFLHFFRKVVRVRDLPGRCGLNKGFIRPLMEYSSLVWMGASPSALSQLDKVQHKAIQIISPDVSLPTLHLRDEQHSAFCTICITSKTLLSAWCYPIHFNPTPRSDPCGSARHSTSINLYPLSHPVAVNPSFNHFLMTF